MASPPFDATGDIDMNRSARYTAPLALAMLIAGSAHAAPPATYPFTWSTVVNNGDYLPTDLCPIPPHPQCVEPATAVRWPEGDPAPPACAR